MINIGSSEGSFGQALGFSCLILVCYFFTDLIVGLITSFVLLPAFQPFSTIIIFVVTAFIVFCIMWAIYCKTKIKMSAVGGFFAAVFTAIIFLIVVAIFTFLFLGYFTIAQPFLPAGTDFWFNLI